MKKLILFTAILGLTQMACRKPQAPSSFSGRWVMVEVKDNRSGLTTTKPFSVQHDVVVTFTSLNSTSGTFTGYTPTNEIGKNAYSTGPNQTISIPVLGMTKAAETPWGTLFVDNICASQEYSFEAGGMLHIKTTNKTLQFHRQ
ncbi:MAG: hypothetical protein INR73_13525 [Williamsia sp.]|nr:hypothetical protein [Williamsia sp.]